MALIEQEMSAEPWIDIPGEVLDILRLWRPTPLVRAQRLEQALGTPARIYFKDESVSPGRLAQAEHRRAQAFYNKPEGIDAADHRDRRRPVGHARWPSPAPSSTSSARCTWCARRSSTKPYRRVMMETWGAECVPSPVDDPTSPGSLGLAISDAVRDAATRDDTHYALGSVLNHVLLHQTVIGLEAREQLAMAGETRPDVVIAPCGGGSNLGGLALPFVEDAGVRLVAVEPSSCPTLTEGRFDYDFGDTAGMTPLLPMYTLGHDFMPPTIHAGGLRYHGDAPIISALVKSRADGGDGLPAGQGVRGGQVQFANAEGRIAAPEAAHAHPRRHRRGARRQGDRRGARSSCSTTPATASSTSPPTTTSTTAASSTVESLAVPTFMAAFPRPRGFCSHKRWRTSPRRPPGAGLRRRPNG